MRNMNVQPRMLLPHAMLLYTCLSNINKISLKSLTRAATADCFERSSCVNYLEAIYAIDFHAIREAGKVEAYNNDKVGQTQDTALEVVTLQTVRCIPITKFLN